MLLAVALFVLGATAAGAAQITWADPAGLCNGESPCFNALADAVANAGPPPATVFVFPGVYPESVDLGEMGSALPGGGPGELAVISVDTTGQPAPGATIDPGAPGGPGTGAALFAVSFPAPLTLDGFTARSPDGNGVDLSLGNVPVHLVRLTADSSPSGAGILVFSMGGEMTVADSVARLNGDAGISVVNQDGPVTVTGCLSERNDASGFTLVGSAVMVSGSRAEANQLQGFTLIPEEAASSFVATDVEAFANGGAGLVAASPIPDVDFATGLIDDVIVTSNLESGLNAVAGQLVAADVAAGGNGSTGMVLVGEVIRITDSSAETSGDIGMILSGDQIDGEGLTANGNAGIGLLVLAESPGATFSLADLEANSNDATGISAGISVLSEAFASGTITGAVALANDQSGIAAGAGNLLLDSVLATGNAGTGITALAVDVELVGARAAGNLTGVVVTGEQVTILDTTASTSGPLGGGTFDGNGFVLVNVDRAEIAGALALDNALGWLVLDLGAGALPGGVDPGVARRELEWLTGGRSGWSETAAGGPVSQEISIVTSRTEGSTGASMQLALREGGRLSVRCSDFVANGSAGLALFTDNTVDARGSFWGDPSGPTHPDNPAGTGDPVHDAVAGFAGTVRFDPFLGALASADDCLLPGAALAIPALGPAGLLLLALVLVLAAWRRIGRWPPNSPLP